MLTYLGTSKKKKLEKVAVIREQVPGIVIITSS
jgi:hypothetical protein